MKEFINLDINDIKDILPHRYPFLLIDKVKIAPDAKTAIGVKNVTNTEPFFQGHFPEKPIMPGVLTIEAMAQTSGIMSLYHHREEAGKLIYFLSVDNCRFRKPVIPGDVMELHVSLEQQRGMICKFHGKAMVEGKVVAEADFAAMTVDSDKA